MAATTFTLPVLHDSTPSTTAPVAPADRAPALARYLVIGVVVTTIVLGLGVTLPIWAAYGGLSSAIGVGAMAAMWGGPCFGLIAGAATYSIRTQD